MGAMVAVRLNAAADKAGKVRAAAAKRCQASPARGNASEFITRAIEDNYEQIAKRENYVDYIANRPRVQKIGAHGLFNGGQDSIVLSQVADEVAHHPGVVWLPIISLRREDANRLGYNNAERWRRLQIWLSQ